jgi:hypothetical protein
MISNSNTEFRTELLKSYQQQFSTSQNQSQQVFLQVLSLLLTVVVGYGFVYTNGGKMDSNIVKGLDSVLAISYAIASLIISFGMLLIFANAHAFRRDQYINAKILREAGLIGNTENDIASHLFLPQYDPAISMKVKIEEWRNYNSQRKINIIKWLFIYLDFIVSWMPNFYNILFFLLAVLHILLPVSLLVNPFDNCVFIISNNLHFPYTIAILFWFLLTSFVYFRLRKFFKRILKSYCIDIANVFI